MAGYIGVDGKAGKVMNLYVGVDGTARQVMKAYVGDENGKARLWWKKIKFVMRFKAQYGLPADVDIQLEACVGMDVHGFCNLKTTVDAFAAHDIVFAEIRPNVLYKWTIGGRTYGYTVNQDAEFVFLERHDGATIDYEFHEVTDP